MFIGTCKQFGNESTETPIFSYLIYDHIFGEMCLIYCAVTVLLLTLFDKIRKHKKEIVITIHVPFILHVLKIEPDW